MGAWMPMEDAGSMHDEDLFSDNDSGPWDGYDSECTSAPDLYFSDEE